MDALAALTIAYELRGQTKQVDATKQDLIEFVNYLGPIFQPLADASAMRLTLMRRQTDAADRRLELLAFSDEGGETSSTPRARTALLVRLL